MIHNLINNLKKKGFTLIEALIGLSILAIATVTVFPLISSSYNQYSNQKIKAEMIFICESVIEKIKAYDSTSTIDSKIYNVDLCYIYEQFNSFEKVELDLKDDPNNTEFIINITKEEKSKDLWILNVTVNYHLEKRGVNSVMYKAYLPKK